MLRLQPFPARTLPDTLLEWQRDAIHSVHAHLSEGAKRVLGVAATGCGKSVLVSNMARAIDARTLVIAHREELIDQLAATFDRWWPEVTVGKVMANTHEPDAHVVVATVQTLVNRLDRVPGPFDLIIVDECHHLPAGQFQKVLDHYCGTADLLPGMPPPADAPIVFGVTATPDRADRKGVAEWFGHRIAFSYDVRWAIDNGYLCDLRTLTLKMDALDLDAVEIRKGDYADGALGRALQSAGAPKLIVDAWKEHGENRQTMVFSPTVEMSKAVAAAFVAAGVTAEHMDGGARKDDRRAVLDRFRAGETKVILNVSLWTEGVDIPETSCVVLARPSRSRAFVSQAIGRGLRLAPGKNDCVVIDVSGATRDNKLVQAHDILGLHRALERHESAKAAMAKEDASEHVAADHRVAEEAESWSHGPARFANTDPFGRPVGCKHPWRHDPTPTCVDRWTHDFDGTRVVVRRGDPAARLWVAGAFDLATKAPTDIASDPLIGRVLDAAEAFIDGHRPAGAWKHDPPTTGQVHMLRRIGWPGDPTTLTKARAGAIIGKHVEADRKKRTTDRDATEAAQVNIPRIDAAIGGRRMISPTDVPSLLGLTPGPVVDDTARRTLAAMEAKGMLRRQGESYVVLRNVEVAS